MRVPGLGAARTIVVADDVSGQAGRTADANRDARFRLVHQRRPIGRFDDIGHVAGGRNVGHGKEQGVVEDVEDFAHQNAGVERDRIPRLCQPKLQDPLTGAP